MKSTRRPFSTPGFALVIVLALIAAACGAEDEPAVEDDPAPEAEPEEADAEPEEDAEEAEEPEEAEEAESEEVAAAEECEGLEVGVAGPFTGDAASIGQEQLNWARFAVDRFNEEHGTDFTVVEGDTQLDPAQATTVAQQFADNDAMLAVVGPAGSPEVEAVGQIFERESLAYVGMSATATELTDGSYPTFFRVVPNDGAQGPTVADFILDELGADEVFVIDDQTSYSTGLADIAGERLEEGGVSVTRESVPQDQTDFSALVSRVTDETDVVFLPWQLATSAQLFAQQMDEQGKEATIFGSDGLFSPEDFRAEGAYVSSFAPDISGIPESEELVASYTEAYGEFETTFGPPTYLAAEVVLDATFDACQAGEATREAALERVADTHIEESILGGDFSFDENGDVADARFYIFQIQDGVYTLVE